MNNIKDNVLFGSPRDLNESTIPEDVKNRLREITDITAKKLDSELGRPAEFEDYVRDFIEQTTFKQVDEAYNSLKYAWNLIGRDISNADAVYNKFYNLKAIHENIYEAYLENSNPIQNSLIEVDSNESQYTNPVGYNTKNQSIQDKKACNPVPKTPSSKCVKCNSNKELSEELCSNCKNDKNLDDFLFGALFIWILGASGIFALIRYLINPEISTEVILVVLFIGFIVVNRYLRSKNN